MNIDKLKDIHLGIIVSSKNRQDTWKITRATILHWKQIVS